MALLEALDAIHRDLGLPEYTGAWVDGKKSMIDVLAITMALMIGTAGLPHVLIRFYTVPNSRAARWSAMWALIFIGLLYTTAPAVSAFARVNMIETLNEKTYLDAPQWFKSWEATGLIVFKDFNGDGIIQYSGDTQKNELMVDRDIMVLANPEIAKLPAWVVALVAAGGLAAALSTAAGLLLVISASVSHDLFKSVLWKNMSQKDELRMARIAAAFAVVVAGLLGIYPPGFVAQVVAFAFGLAAASFFPILLLGIFDKRTTKEGAITGMLLGIGFTAAYIIWFRFVDSTATAEQWLFGISPEGIGTIGMVLNFIATITVSRFTPAPPIDVQNMVDDIRLPSGSRDVG